jgi:DNA (cytosine-5)-methyltransferase 3A
MINSSLVSAQNRQRLYWTNIGMKPSGLFGDLESTIEQPKDKGILLKDILQDNQNSKYYVSNKLIDRINRSNNGKKCFSLNEKSICLASGYYKQGRDNQYIPVEEKYYLSEKMINGFLQHNKKHIEEKNQTGFNWKPTDGNKKANCLRANAALCPTDNTIIVKEKQVVQLNPSKESGGRQPYQQNRVYDLLGIAPALCANKSDLIINTPIYRRLTPIECERLQTVKDNYTNHVSDSQRYKMLGNGWTVDVIAHIFSYIV